MKKLIYSIAIIFSSFFSVSQIDTTTYDLGIISPILFLDCDDTLNVMSLNSNDIDAIYTMVHSNYSVDEYIANILIYNEESNRISNIWVEISDGYNLITVKFCSLNLINDVTTLKSEYTKVFNYLKQL